MAWSLGKKIGGGGGGNRPWREEPDSKRRKVDESVPQVEQTGTQDVNDDEWGDDDYTQDQLEQLALLDSQVSLQVPAVATTAEQPHMSFVTPAFVTPAFVTPVGAPRKSTSSSSNSSAHPQSLSSSRSANETSSSLSSHSSSNGKPDQSIEPLLTLHARLEEVKRKAQEEKNCYDGQVRTLRDKLHKQEEELERLRAVRDENYEQQKQVLNEENRKLKSQLDNLSTQACFKDKECQNLLEKCAALQQKVRKIEQQQPSNSGLLDARLQLSPKPGSPRKVTVQPSPPSKQRQQEARDSASSSRTSFPTTQTFMEQTSPVSHVSPGKFRPRLSSKMPDQRSGRMPVRPRFLLNIGSSQVFGQMAGPEIVRHLFQCADLEAEADVKEEKVLGEAGLCNLLQDMSASLKIAGLTYSRQQDSHFLMPQRPKKHTQGSRSSNMDTSDGTVQIVSRQNVQLAIEGLSQLLQDTSSSLGTGGLDSEIRRISDMSINTNIPNHAEPVQGYPGTVDPDADPVVGTRSPHVDLAQTSEGIRSSLDATRRTETSRNSGAVLILSLLTNYIQHYVDFIHSSSARVGGADRVTSPQTLDSSTDSSFESLTSNMGLLLQEGRLYASNIEGCVIRALRCLFTLVYLCPAVRHTIVTATQPGLTPPFSAFKVGSCRSSSSSNVETETEQSKKTPPSADADDECSTSSSEVRIIKVDSNQSNQSVNSASSHLGSRVSSSLFHLVLSLAGQHLEDGQSNPEVVNLALRILTCLCQYSSKEELPKLEPIITREILAKCFRQTSQKSLLIHAVRLLLSLAKSDKLLAKFCTKSDSCPLYLMNRACSMTAEGTKLQREYVICLASIISEHRAGLHFLLSNACPCTDKLVASVVLMLYNLFSTYSMAKAHQQLDVLHTLIQGIYLVHTLAQADGLFGQHCLPVHLQYVRLITGLSSILKSDPKTWEQHFPVIDELNEFESDSSDTSQESDDDDKMDPS
ncbi:hypothetical protein BsWGS_13776 [Bradybaena similaris]